MTYQVLEKYSYTMEHKLDKSTDRLISNAPSTPIPETQELLTLTVTYTCVLPVEYKETVYKLLQDKKG